MINNFELQAKARDLGINRAINIISTEKDTGTINLHTRFKSAYKGMPIYALIVHWENETEIDFKEIERQFRVEEYKINQIIEKPFSNDHKNYVKISTPKIFGNEYSEAFLDATFLIFQKIEEKLNNIYKVRGDNFKEIYKEFINTFDTQNAIKEAKIYKRELIKKAKKRRQGVKC